MGLGSWEAGSLWETIVDFIKESVSKAPEDDAFANLEMSVPDCDGDTYVHKLRKHGKLETM